ncbi:hypothetical protein DFH09DRAFT_1304234 [Mycena vulgaris]|nr:hypothetical protein DFH09DRAFT_1304234 [Mycena vulgaris]
MAFLRKKRQDSAPPPPPVRTPSPPVTPLFARFASTTAQSSAQRVVSSPMTLASTPRRDQVPRMTNGGGVRGGVQQQQWEDAKQPRYTVEPSYVQPNPPGSSTFAAASTSNGNSSSYGSPAQKRRSTPPSRTQTLPATAPASSPPSRRLSQIPGADKPLPMIYPQDNRPDPLGSTPPQSSLPANRRASTRGFPPQTSAAIQNLPNGRVMNVPAQHPHIFAPTKPPDSPSPSLGTRTLPPSSSQTPSANPDPTSGPSQSPSRYPKEYGRQDLRHKFSDAGSSASAGPPAIPGPASPPRQGTPGRWAPDARGPSAVSASYQVNFISILFSFCGRAAMYRNRFMILVPPHMHDSLSIWGESVMPLFHRCRMLRTSQELT